MINLPQVRSIYIAYASIKLQLEDWHGLRDIAAELEVLDQRIKDAAHAATYPAPVSLSTDVDSKPT